MFDRQLINSKQLLTIPLLVCFLLFSQTAMNKELVVGVEDIEYYPLYAKRAGKYSGFARDLFDAFAKHSGHTIRYRPLPIKRLYSEFLNGRVDLKFPDNPVWASDKKADKSIRYSDGIIEYIDGVMVLPENSDSNKTQLKLLGTVRGFTPWDYLNDIANGTIEVKENSDLDGLVKLIKRGRVDGGYFNVLVARYFLKHTLFEENAIVFNQNLPHSRGKYHLSTIQHPDVIEQFNTFMREQKSLIKILEKKYEIALQ